MPHQRDKLLISVIKYAVLIKIFDCWMKSHPGPSSKIHKNAKDVN